MEVPETGSEVDAGVVSQEPTGVDAGSVESRVDVIIADDTSTNSPETVTEIKEPTEAVTLEGIKYGDTEVNINIPADVLDFAAEKGLDAQEIAKELYASEDFTVSPETKAKLDEAFGAWAVDAYLNGIKASNDMFISNHNTEQETKTANETAAWEATMEIMGGEDRWNDMAAHAVSTLSEQELDEFDDVMKNGSLKMQQLMIRDMYVSFEAAGAPESHTILDLESGETGGDSSNEGGALTQQQYLDLITTGEYDKNRDSYDKRRQAGINKGI